MSLTAGKRLGPYEIQSALGAGGMGEVYRARDTRLDRTVAIKILPHHLFLADDPVAADATCARLMGFEPDRIVHIREGARFLGNSSRALIDQVGETPTHPTIPFETVPEFRHLYAL